MNGLRRASRYELKVQALNGAGAGPFSGSVFTSTLPFDCPKAPKILTVKPHSTSLELSWTVEGEEPVSGMCD